MSVRTKIGRTFLLVWSQVTLSSSVSHWNLNVQVGLCGRANGRFFFFFFCCCCCCCCCCCWDSCDWKAETSFIFFGSLRICRCLIFKGFWFLLGSHRAGCLGFRYFFSDVFLVSYIHDYMMFVWRVFVGAWLGYWVFYKSGIRRPFLLMHTAYKPVRHCNWSARQTDAIVTAKWTSKSDCCPYKRWFVMS